MPRKNIDTSYARYQSLMINRVACIVVLGVLIYQIIQAYAEEGPMPVWFMPGMIALVIGVLGVLAWNFISLREFHRAQAIARAEEAAGDDGRGYSAVEAEQADDDAEQAAEEDELIGGGEDSDE